MAAQKQDDQHERTFSSYVRIQVVVLKTCLGRWTIGRSGERGSGISVLPARYDDDDLNSQFPWPLFVHLRVYLRFWFYCFDQEIWKNWFFLLRWKDIFFKKKSKSWYDINIDINGINTRCRHDTLWNNYFLMNYWRINLFNMNMILALKEKKRNIFTIGESRFWTCNNETRQQNFNKHYFLRKLGGPFRKHVGHMRPAVYSLPTTRLELFFFSFSFLSFYFFFFFLFSVCTEERW